MKYAMFITANITDVTVSWSSVI